MDTYTLFALLLKHDVPLSLWGTGEAKTMQDLLKELNEEQSLLVETETGLLQTYTRSGLNVYHDDGTRVWNLRELKQVFRDGSITQRRRLTSIGTNLKRCEEPIDAAYRALNEELGISDHLPLIAKPMIVQHRVPSISFPGIDTIYTVHIFDVFLPARHYKPGGYVERQDHKTSYFVWSRHH
jgi:hypothetical protein